ncbi:MAG: metallopeptidase family protein [Chloroflexia bacterium]
MVVNDLMFGESAGGRARFEELVADAIDTLPDEILEMLDNVEIVVADAPTASQLTVAGELGAGEMLLGLYEGIPLTERTSGYGMVLPDKITLFQGALESVCRDEEMLRSEVRVTVVHELAHHFGISDRRLRELGWG